MHLVFFLFSLLLLRLNSSMAWEVFFLVSFLYSCSSSNTILASSVLLDNNSGRQLVPDYHCQYLLLPFY